MSDEHLAPASLRRPSSAPQSHLNTGGDPLTDGWIRVATALAITLEGTSVSADELAVALEWTGLLEFLDLKPPGNRPVWYAELLARCELDGISPDTFPTESLPFDHDLPRGVIFLLRRRRPLGECFRALLDSQEQVFTGLYGAPKEVATPTNPRLRLKLAFDCAAAVEAELRQRLVGQSEAVGALKRLAFQRELQRGILAPPATALFLGPPGVGKSLAARQFAAALGKQSQSGKAQPLAVLEVEMTQHVQWGSGADLIGDGNRQGSITSFVAKNPQALIVCNELEKANRKVLEAFLPVLDQGLLPSSNGNVDFRDAVFVFTSNLGSELWSRPSSAGEGALEVDLMDLLSLSEAPDPRSESHKTPVPKELLSRLAKGAVVLFRRHHGHHMLGKLQQGCMVQKKEP